MMGAAGRAGGLLSALAGILAGCSTQMLGPDEQAMVYRGAVHFVEAHAIADGCPSLMLDKAALASDAGKLLEELKARGYSRADAEAYLRTVPDGAIGASAGQRLAAAGITGVDLANPAENPEFCVLGNRERARGSVTGGFLTDAG